MASIPDFWTEALEVIRAAPIGYLAIANGEQPTVRAVTPAYVGVTAYVATEPLAFKIRAVQSNPLVELMHPHADFRHVTLRGRAMLVEDEALKTAMWDKFPYDLAEFFAEGGAEYGLMAIEPFRIELMSLGDYAASKPPRIWRPDD